MMTQGLQFLTVNCWYTAWWLFSGMHVHHDYDYSRLHGATSIVLWSILTWMSAFQRLSDEMRLFSRAKIPHYWQRPHSEFSYNPIFNISSLVSLQCPEISRCSSIFEGSLYILLFVFCRIKGQASPLHAIWKRASPDILELLFDRRFCELGYFMRLQSPLICLHFVFSLLWWLYIK